MAKQLKYDIIRNSLFYNKGCILKSRITREVYNGKDDKTEGYQEQGEAQEEHKQVQTQAQNGATEGNFTPLLGTEEHGGHRGMPSTSSCWTEVLLQRCLQMPQL